MMSTLTTPTQHSTGSLGQHKRQQKERKNIQTGKKEIKQFLFVNDMTVWVENLEEYTHTKPVINQ